MLWGLQKTWRRGSDQLVALRLESLNYEINPPGENRGAGAIYTHSSGSNQGHTQRGQMLGASPGPGSGAPGRRRRGAVIPRADGATLIGIP